MDEALGAGKSVRTPARLGYRSETPAAHEVIIIGTDSAAFMRRMTLVTRNIKDFEGMGVALVNPWDLRT
ncbi:hypothetical protein B5K06_30665 [Rhizobium grahamii]|uniref:Type II toxin-antitoxin system VapC family toxin n=2 Tax=Rhizobium grahamii TaxID=1120045 RepID=A0A370KEY2_9HYPH|nr:putative plasmid stabilization protein [Rhizobium grahamii CCGE 502]RDJ02887.1 hypothetical protein B5K06_30665 [Rhizobium grahamii]